jgi:hypothetical protein
VLSLRRAAWASRARRARTALIDPEADLRAQVFTVAALAGIAISLVTALVSALNRMGAAQVVLNLAAACAAVGLLRFTRRTGRYRPAYVITVVAVFLMAFPALFFSGGGYSAGMPAFFVFAIAFTAFILEGALLWSLVGLEVVVYTVCCVTAFQRPGWVRPVTGAAAMWDSVYALVAAGVTLAVAFHVLLRVYERAQRQLARSNESKSRFLASTAHELNTPLALVQLHAEEALAGAGESASVQALRRHNLEVVAAETVRLAGPSAEPPAPSVPAVSPPAEEPAVDVPAVADDWVVDSLTQDDLFLTAAHLMMVGSWTLELESEGGEWVEDQDLPEGSLHLYPDGDCSVTFNEDAPSECGWYGYDDVTAVVEFQGFTFDTIIDEDGWLVLEDAGMESILYYTADDPPGDMTLQLDEDGAFVFEVFGETAEGWWEWDGEELTLTAEEADPITGFLDGDSLILETDEGGYVALSRDR